MTRAVLCLCASLVAGCAREPTELVPAFVLVPVVDERVTELEAALSAATANATATGAPEGDELVERVRGLVLETGPAQGRWRETFRDDAASIGPAALPLLLAAVRDDTLDADQRVGAIELIEAVGGPDAARALLELLENDRTDWVRRHATWRLGACGEGWVVPRLLRRLYYETDGETVVWTSSVLAGFGNLAGLDGLFELEQHAATEEVRDLATRTLAELVRTHEAADATALWWAWNTSGGMPAREPSDRERLEVWRFVRELSGERFQLRGVDEARFVLARGAEWTVEILCAALHDADTWTRVHVAQCLERMGTRARTAGVVLRTALAEPGCAAACAAALGAVGDADAAPALVARLGTDHDPELRHAAARALGRMGLPVALDPLRALLEPTEPTDLRQTAATSLVALGRGEEVVDFLLACLDDPVADPDGAELALGRWLAAEAERGTDGAASTWERWRALDPPTDTAPERDEVRARRAERARLLRAWRDVR